MYLGVSPNTKGFPRGEPFVFLVGGDSEGSHGAERVVSSE